MENKRINKIKKELVKGVNDHNFALIAIGLFFIGFIWYVNWVFEVEGCLVAILLTGALVYGIFKSYTSEEEATNPDEIKKVLQKELKFVVHEIAQRANTQLISYEYNQFFDWSDEKLALEQKELEEALQSLQQTIPATSQEKTEV